MVAATLNFTPQEYEARLWKTRIAMEALGVETLLIPDPSNMAWLTGYDGWSFYVHQAVVVNLEDEPLWWGRLQDSNGALLTVWMSDDRVYGYPEELIHNPDSHPMEHLAGILRTHGDDRVIGVDMDNQYFTASAWETLRRSLPDTRFVDTGALVNWQRVVKSDQEIVYMRRAARIVEAMHRRIAEIVEPGIRKNEIVAEISSIAALGADGYGGDYASIVPLLPTGIDATAPHLTWDDRPLERGAGTFFEVAGCHRRYHAPLCRTVYLGEPPPEMMAAEAAVLAGLEAGIEAARAGNTAGHIARALDAELAAIGIERKGRCGYSIGMSYPPDWGERTISLRSTDTTELVPDMTLHFMPGLWMREWGLEITESIRIQREGPAETLASVPRPILVKS